MALPTVPLKNCTFLQAFSASETLSEAYMSLLLFHSTFAILSPVLFSQSFLRYSQFLMSSISSL